MGIDNLPEDEKQVLAICLGHNQLAPLIFEALNESQFTSLQAKAIFLASRQAFLDGFIADPSRVGIELERTSKEVYKEIGREGLLDLTILCPEAPNINGYIKSLRDKYKRKELVAIGNKIAQAAKDGGLPEKIIDFAGDSLNNLGLVDSLDANKTSASVRETKKQIWQDLYESSNRKEGELVGFGSGIKNLDKLLLGFKPGELITIGARPSMGKSALALQIAYNVSQNYGPVLFFSLEMSEMELTKRLISQVSHVPYRALQTGKLTENEWKGLSTANSILTTNIEIDTQAVTTLSVVNLKIKNFIRKNKQPPALIVVDYYQLIENKGSNSNMNRTEAVAEITRMFKNVASEYGCPVIGLSQLSRNLESRPDKRPILSDLRESGSIEQDSNVVIFVYRDEIYNPDSPDQGIAELIVAKNRSGETGTIKVAFMNQFTEFANLAPTDI